jgi:hypothetical protein
MIRKADKSNTLVILNKYYVSKLDSLVGDTQKFRKIPKDTNDALKKTLNDLIELGNRSAGTKVIEKLIGQYKPGYLYGNPKIHKSLESPPLRPIISQISTPSYTVAQKLNFMLKQYITSGHMIESTDEFLNILRTSNSTGLIASLDVESLFTNVPVHETIDIILDHGYNHPSLPPPLISKTILKQL